MRLASARSSGAATRARPPPWSVRRPAATRPRWWRPSGPRDFRRRGQSTSGPRLRQRYGAARQDRSPRCPGPGALCRAGPARASTATGCCRPGPRRAPHAAAAVGRDARRRAQSAAGRSPGGAARSPAAHPLSRAPAARGRRRPAHGREDQFRLARYGRSAAERARVGRVVSLTLLAELPALGRLLHKQIARSWAWPCSRDSGTLLVYGGRARAGARRALHGGPGGEPAQRGDPPLLRPAPGTPGSGPRPSRRRWPWSRACGHCSRSSTRWRVAARPGSPRARSRGRDFPDSC